MRTERGVKRITDVPSRTERVYAAIRESICDCSLAPGTHLVQEELAAQLGVSRQPVQQAMLLLKNDGLVEELGGRGLYVSPLDPERIGHHYQIRMVLDQLAARLCATRAGQDEAFRARLRTEGDAILTIGAGALEVGSAVEAVRRDVDFHNFLYDMSGNPLIATAAAAHWSFLRRVMVAVLLHADRGPLVWRQHGTILDALVAGDVETGDRLARDHVTGAEEALRAALRSGRAGAMVGVPPDGDAASAGAEGAEDRRMTAGN
jgi:DNA-binding GntR family transcriptional regulator